ncbi:MAG: tRNA (guanine(46)-N(7))-methyltransferase TrmB [Verrucomicrobia bacterium]|nr:tRNA (guanine(46)-N(7))-methyltransferase TrmB [Verrucomicrobiota bacterium]
MVSPKDLYYPFSETSKKVLLKDGVLYLPDKELLEEGSFYFAWDENELFPQRLPIHIEYCSGNGDWVIEKAKADPSTNWIAVERQFARVRKIWSKKVNGQLSNLLIIYGEAFQVTRDCFPAAAFAAASIHFPDPWPKRRHAKHRLLAAPFFEQVHRVLKKDAPFTLVTDHFESATRSVEALNQHGGFYSQHPSPHWVEPPLEAGTSWFERLWRSQGCKIYSLCYINSDATVS